MGRSSWSGTLMTAAGEPSRGRISLVAWPRKRILSNIKTGDVIKTVPVAKSAAGADGAFEMRIDPSVPLAEFMEGDGIVNFDLVADGPTGVAVFSFPRRLATDGGRTTWLATERATAASESALILDVALDDGPPIGDDPAAPPPPTDKFCVVTNVATWDLRQTIVGEVFTGPVATANLTYTSGSSSSTVGVGYSVSGTLGTWSQSGTMSTSSTSTENFPTQFQTIRSRCAPTSVGRTSRPSAGTEAHIGRHIKRRRTNTKVAKSLLPRARRQRPTAFPILRAAQPAATQVAHTRSQLA